MKLVDGDVIRSKCWDEGINTEVDGERGVFVRFKKIEQIIDKEPELNAIPIEWIENYLRFNSGVSVRLMLLHWSNENEID